jgi:hypothetical protein
MAQENRKLLHSANYRTRPEFLQIVLRTRTVWRPRAAIYGDNPIAPEEPGRTPAVPLAKRGFRDRYRRTSQAKIPTLRYHLRKHVIPSIIADDAYMLSRLLWRNPFDRNASVLYAIEQTRLPLTPPDDDVELLSQTDAFLPDSLLESRYSTAFLSTQETTNRSSGRGSSEP